MMRPQHRTHAFAKHSAGAIVDALAALFDNDIALREEGLVRVAQIAHAIGFHTHDEFEPVARDTDVVGRVIPRGEGVIVSAIARDGARILAGRNLARALEHQVFKEMRDARMAARFIRRADAIPHHMRNHRRAAIGDHHDLHAVGERERLWPRKLLSASAREQQKRRGKNNCERSRKRGAHRIQCDKIFQRTSSSPSPDRKGESSTTRLA